MNTLHKLLKITGAICLSCICLTSKADPKLMTLEELRTFLNEQCKEGCRNLKDIREKIEAGNSKGFAPTYDKAKNFYSYGVPKEFSENFKGITHVEYNENGEPTVIKTVNGGSLEIGDVLNPMGSRFGSYIREKFPEETPTARLKRISKELTTKELKKRGVTDAEGELLGGALICEITFDSILGSDFFDDTRRGKGESWFKNQEELEKAIDSYADKLLCCNPLPVV